MPKTPKDVPEDEAWFDEIARRYSLRPDERALLAAARQAWLRWRAIVDRIDADGLLVNGRWDIPKAHPLLGPEARARQQVLAAIRALGFTE